MVILALKKGFGMEGCTHERGRIGGFGMSQWRASSEGNKIMTGHV